MILDMTINDIRYDIHDHHVYIQIALLRAMFWLQQLTDSGVESAQLQAVNTYSSHWALFCVVLLRGMHQKMVHVSTPMTPGFNMKSGETKVQIPDI